MFVKKNRFKSQFSCKSQFYKSFRKVLNSSARYCILKWIKVMWIRSGDAKGSELSNQLYFNILIEKNAIFESSQKRVFWNLALIRGSTSGHSMKKSTRNNPYRLKDQSITLYQVVKMTLERSETEFWIFSNFFFIFL